APRDAGLARGLQRVEPRAADRLGRYVRAGRGPDSRARAHRHRPGAPPVQPAARRDGPVRAGGVPAGRKSDAGEGGRWLPPSPTLIQRPEGPRVTRETVNVVTGVSPTK